MEQKEAAFKFEGYKIIRSYIEIPQDGDSNKKLIINIKPSGLRKEDVFNLKLEVKIRDKEESVKVDVDIVATFKFSNIPEDKLGSYFLSNAPAIVFPYVRAYISALSSLSGIKTVILPTLNMSELAQELAENIKNIS